MTVTADLVDRFERVAQLHGERLMGYLVRRVASDEAPDVAAEVLTTAWRRVRLMPAEDEEALWWLLAIARRTLANHRRGLIRRQALAERLRDAHVVTAPSEEGEIVGLLGDAINQLAEYDRELVRLVYWDGLSAKGASEVLGIGDAAARKRLQRIRGALRSTITHVDVGTHLP